MTMPLPKYHPSPSFKIGHADNSVAVGDIIEMNGDSKENLRRDWIGRSPGRNTYHLHET